jgi:exodeoxyribonuclease VII large subunit
VNQLNRRLTKNIRDAITVNRTRLDNISQKSIFRNPETIYEIKWMNLDNLVNRLTFTSQNIITQNRNKLLKLESSHVLKNPKQITDKKRERYLKNLNKLEVLNPLLTLKRGYAIAKSDDKVISSVKDVEVGDEVDIEFDDGIINTKVI